MREETEFRPKPMVTVGGKPVLWHIMKTFANAGVNDFIILTGYRGEIIKEYFLNYAALQNDFTIRLGVSNEVSVHGAHEEADWAVTVLDTGLNTPTGGRLLQAEEFLRGEPFFCTYGDGVADINLGEVWASHLAGDLTATVSVGSPPSRFGILQFDEMGKVIGFREKPIVDDWVNIGYFAFSPSIFDSLSEDVALEGGPLQSLAESRELNAYKHSGFWHPMDTIRDREHLENLWANGSAPWRTWQ